MIPVSPEALFAFYGDNLKTFLRNQYVGIRICNLKGQCIIWFQSLLFRENLVGSLNCHGRGMPSFRDEEIVHATSCIAIGR